MILTAKEIRNRVDADWNGILDVVKHRIALKAISSQGIAGDHMRRSAEYVASLLQEVGVDARAVQATGADGQPGAWEVIGSLAVDPERQGTGIGRAMVEWKIARMREEMPGFRLFALTLSPEFFRRLGFVDTGMEQFPEKFWSDCRNCPKKDRCDEVAVLYAGDNGSGA